MIRVRRAGAFLAIFAVGALASSGCGEDGNDVNAGSGATPVAAAPNQLELKDFSLSPSAIDVAAGTKIALSNAGANQHDLVVEGSDVTSHILDPGAVGTLDTSSLAPGTYVVYCSITGHREAGMEGTLTIT